MIISKNSHVNAKLVTSVVKNQIRTWIYISAVICNFPHGGIGGVGGGEGRYQHVTGKTPLPPSLLFPSFLLQRLVSSTVMRGKTKRFSSGTPGGRDYPIRSATMRACKYNTSTKKLPTRDETQWERMHGSFVIHHDFLLIPLGVSVVALYSILRPSLEQSQLSRYSLWQNGRFLTQMLSQLCLSALSTKKTSFAISLPS